MLPPPSKVDNAVCNCWFNLESVHRVSIPAGWTKAVYNVEFAQYFYTWPDMGIEP